MRPRTLAALIAPVLLLAGLMPAAAASDVAAYRQGLEVILHDCDERDVDAARDHAARLRRERVTFGDETIRPDATVLDELAKASEPNDLAAVRPRLAALIDALDRDDTPPGALSPPDPSVIKRLRREQEYVGPDSGGDIDRMPSPNITLPEWFQDKLEKFGRWLADALEDFFDWLGLTRRSRGGVSGVGTMRLIVIVLIATVAIVLAIALYYAFTRGRLTDAGAVVASTVEARSQADEDPLSRSATQWQTYAAELQRAGRTREAIRAWYHAILVTLFHAGILHHRKGRTNWEYAYSLRPDVAWRGAYLDLTREFERCWYGHAPGDASLSSRFGRSAQDILGTVRRERSA